jgi:hypothetical protein
MKNTIKLIGIIALAAVIGLTMTACNDSGGSDGKKESQPALTGTVSITGTAQVGQTLTADTGSLGGSGTISYQWKRGTANIGTNSSTYTVQSADAGYTITVTVTRSGNSGSVTSQPTSEVTGPTVTYTVRYDKNAADASGTTADSTHTYDLEKALTANGYTRTDYTFVGWNTQANGGGTGYTNSQYVKNLTSTTGAVFTLYAVWLTHDEADFGTGANITNTFNVSTTAEWNTAVSTIVGGGNDKNYIINVTADFSVTGISVYSYSFGSVSGVTISLRGPDRTLSLSGKGFILKLSGSHTVILRDLTLRGSNSNETCLVYNGGGNFTMHSGKITDNNSSFMWGGQGGGLYNSGTFTMNGGEISGNTSTSDDDGGGGVYTNHTFTMNGGKISGNTSTSDGGGGVYMDNGSFTINGGEISGNTSTSDGGGVFNNNNWYDTSFTMNGGKISGNTATANGGGVYIRGTFTMKGGEISGNTSTSGGGVYNSGTFRIITGTIYGTNEGANSNVATEGAALYKGDSSTVQYGALNSYGFFSRIGDLNKTNNTIRVLNGVLE